METSPKSHMTHTPAADTFSQDAANLPAAVASRTVELGDGDTFDLIATPVRKQIGDAEVRMLAYNGSIPGPTLRVQQGSTITVNFTNQIDLESTVHWHGLRLDNRYDGTHETQTPVSIGKSFTYRLNFPDPGIYWYHPHIREDYGQEMGLYGNVLVVPAGAGYWAPAHREVTLILDDVLIEDGQIAPFSRSQTNYTAMGRFGNVLLINGEPHRQMSARRGEVVRFYLTNTANTRVFNIGFSGARMKLVGGDSGRCEQEQFVTSVLLSPSERVIVDVLFDQPGRAGIEHRSPERVYEFATIDVSDEPISPPLAESFEQLRRDPELAAERERMPGYLAAAPDKTLAFVAEMNLGDPAPAGSVVYACPMHPEVVSQEPGRCPKCGMALLPVAQETAPTYSCPMHPEVVSDQPGNCPKCGMKLLPTELTQPAQQHGHGHGHEQGHDMPAHDDMHQHHGHHAESAQHGHAEHHQHDHTQHHGGQAEPDAPAGIEWEDDMVAVNRMTTPANMRWLLIDRSNGAANHAIDWHFRVSQQVRIRLVNEMDSDHPMPHPFHIHGAGRFLVLSRNGQAERNLMWKDTVLVGTGETVDILLQVTNPGVWMAHCHIAEHHESGMMFTFHVDE